MRRLFVMAAWINVRPAELCIAQLSVLGCCKNNIVFSLMDVRQRRIACMQTTGCPMQKKRLPWCTKCAFCPQYCSFFTMWLEPLNLENAQLNNDASLFLAAAGFLVNLHKYCSCTHRMTCAFQRLGFNLDFDVTHSAERYMISCSN